MELKGAKINFLGDSITEGAGVTQEERYTDLIGSKFGAEIRNYGLGGTRIARQTKPSECDWFDRDFILRMEEMDPDADVVVVFGGTNDCGHGDAPYGEMSDRTPDTFYGAMHTLCRKLQEKYPDALILFMTPMHRLHEEGYAPGRRDLRSYVQAMREVCEYYSLPVLDLYATYGVNPDVPVLMERFMPDGLHPNAAGHRMLAEQLAAFLRACPEKRRIL